jgi:multiple sugar transport system permease protein
MMLDTDYGTLNELLLTLNIVDSPVRWLKDTMLAQLSVANIQTWMWFGNSFILFMAAVQAVNKEVIESAVIDGCGRLSIMRYVKLPLIKPILIYVGVTSLIGGLQLFDVPYLITDGRGAPSGSLNTVIVYLFNHAFTYRNFGYASAIAFMLFLIIMTVSGIFVLIMNRSRVKDFLNKKKNDFSEYRKRKKANI